MQGHSATRTWLQEKGDTQRPEQAIVVAGQRNQPFPVQLIMSIPNQVAKSVAELKAGWLAELLIPSRPRKQPQNDNETPGGGRMTPTP